MGDYVYKVGDKIRVSRSKHGIRLYKRYGVGEIIGQDTYGVYKVSFPMHVDYSRDAPLIISLSNSDIEIERLSNREILAKGVEV